MLRLYCHSKPYTITNRLSNICFAAFAVFESLGFSAAAAATWAFLRVDVSTSLILACVFWFLPTQHLSQPLPQFFQRTEYKNIFSLRLITNCRVVWDVVNRSAYPTICYSFNCYVHSGGVRSPSLSVSRLANFCVSRRCICVSTVPDASSTR